jgi:hypothetical protein
MFRTATNYATTLIRRIIFIFNSIKNDFARENYKNIKKTGQISKTNQKNWKKSKKKSLSNFIIVRVIT